MKTTTTEKYHTNCPNCGGVIGPNDKFCTYCGTRVVYERTVTHEDDFSFNMDYAKIEKEVKSTIDDLEKSAKSALGDIEKSAQSVIGDSKLVNNVFLIVGIILSAIWSLITLIASLIFTFAFGGGGILFLLFIAGMISLVIQAVALVKNLKNK